MKNRKNNRFTPAQIKSLKNKYSEIANGEIEIDGTKSKKKKGTHCLCNNREISKDNFAEFYNNLFSVTISEKENKCFKLLGLHVLKTVNKDDDENMSFQEFEDLMYFHSVASPEEKQRFVYRLHDLDNSGMVERHEFTKLARLMRGKKTGDKLSYEEQSQIKKDFEKLAGERESVTEDMFMKGSYVINCEMFMLLVNRKVRRKMGFKEKPTSDKEIMQRTGFTVPQVKVLKKKFKGIAHRSKWDLITGKPGQIDRKRFVDFYVDFFMKSDNKKKNRKGTHTNPTPYACLMFDSLDDKEDEVANIDFHEFVNLIKLHTIATKNEIIMWIYHLHDNDESGFIDEDEFLYVAKCMKETVGTFSKEDEGKVRKEFWEIAGEDGMIDKYEFLESDYILNCPIYKSITENPMFSHAKN